MLIPYNNFAGVMQENFFLFLLLGRSFISKAQLTHTYIAQMGGAFFCLDNHSNCPILLNGLSRPGYVCKNVERKATSQPVKHIVEQRAEKQVVHNCYCEDHFDFLFYNSTVLSVLY